MSRGWLLASLLFGCGFKPAVATGDGALADDDARSFDGPGVGSDSGTPFLPACTTDSSFTKRPNTSHSYRMLTAVNASFDDAFDACSSAGGAHLAQIADAAENTYLHGTYPAANWYFGFTDLVTEGTFRQADHELGTYAHWAAPQEPSDGGGKGEDCAIMQGDGLWNDVNCAETHNPVCECEPDFHAPPIPTCRSTAGFKLGNGRKYFVLEPATWTDANATCTGMGGYLMVPSDADENDTIEDGAGINANNDVWIGLMQDPNDGAKWAWSNSSPYIYQRWDNDTEPAAAPGMCGRVLKNSDSDWQSADCTTQLRAICECDPGVY